MVTESIGGRLTTLCLHEPAYGGPDDSELACEGASNCPSAPLGPDQYRHRSLMAYRPLRTYQRGGS